MDRLSVASFFSGVGGLDLGFKNQGFEFKFANDNWKGCISKHISPILKTSSELWIGKTTASITSF